MIFFPGAPVSLLIVVKGDFFTFGNHGLKLIGRI